MKDNLWMEVGFYQHGSGLAGGYHSAGGVRDQVRDRDKDVEGPHQQAGASDGDRGRRLVQKFSMDEKWRYLDNEGSSWSSGCDRSPLRLTSTTDF